MRCGAGRYRWGRCAALHAWPMLLLLLLLLLQGAGSARLRLPVCPATMPACAISTCLLTRLTLCAAPQARPPAPGLPGAAGLRRRRRAGVRHWLPGPAPWLPCAGQGGGRRRGGCLPPAVLLSLLLPAPCRAVLPAAARPLPCCCPSCCMRRCRSRQRAGMVRAAWPRFRHAAILAAPLLLLPGPAPSAAKPGGAGAAAAGRGSEGGGAAGAAAGGSCGRRARLTELWASLLIFLRI